MGTGFGVQGAVAGLQGFAMSSFRIETMHVVQ